MSHQKAFDSPGLDDEDKYGGAAHVEHPNYSVSLGSDGQPKSTVHIRSAEEKAAELRAAQLADPGPKVGTKAHAMFVFYVMVCCMCSGDNGFDG